MQLIPTKSNRGLPSGMVVLGLTTSHFRKQLHGHENRSRYVGMTCPDITISNHRLPWAVDGMRFTAPLLEVKFIVQNHKNQRRLEVLHLFRCFTHRHIHTKTHISYSHLFAHARSEQYAVATLPLLFACDLQP